MISVAQVRAILCTDPNQDVILARLIEEATATLGRALLEYLGPVGAFVEVRDVKCCAGAFKATLDRLPIAVSLVEQRRSPFLAYEEVDAENWAVVGRDLISRSGFIPGAGALRVTYTAGYAVGEGPAELRALVEALVISKYRGVTVGTTEGTFKSESLGDYSYTRFGMDELMAQSGWESVSRQWKRMLI